MRFVEIGISGGGSIYVNPQAVRSVSPHGEGHCAVRLDIETIAAVGPAGDMVRKLDEALKP
jgi:hypothetical protein